MDKTHRTWFLISLVIFVVATVSYIVYSTMFAPNGPSGGSLMGLTYGIVGSLMMIFAGLLAGRKQVPTWTIGSAKFWLRGHLWLGTLSFPLILYHAGFGWGGLVENILWITFGIVIVSGFFGLAVQQFLPRFLTSRLPNETFHSQVPFLCKQMQFLGDKDIAECCERLDVDYKPLTEVAREVSRQRKWLQRDSDFEKILAETYTQAPPVAGDKKGKKTTKKKSVAKKDGPSPIDQMKAQAAGAAKPASPLEQARAQAAAKEDGAKKSPLELAREQAAAKKDGGSGDKKLSPLEMARAQGAAGGKKKAAPTAGMSPLEMARRQGAADSKKKEAAKPAAAKPAPAAAKPAKAKTPAVSQIKVKNVDDEVAAVQSLLTEKYGYAKETAADFANRTRPFLTDGKAAGGTAAKKKAASKGDMIVVGDVDAEINSITTLLTDKYGYGEKLASEIAQASRAFLREPEPGEVDPDQEVKAIENLFTEKYGYSTNQATDIAEKARPFLVKAEEPEPEEAEKKVVESTVVAANAPAAPSGPVSILDRARAEGAVGSGKRGAMPAAPAAPAADSDKPMSPIEIMRAQMAAKKGGAAAPAKSDKPAAKKAVASKAPMPKKAAAKAAISPELQRAELKAFYLQQVRPYLRLEERSHRFNSRVELSRAFAQMRSNLPVEFDDVLGRLQSYCEDRRQFRIQERLLKWMHVWILFHVPISMALFVFFIVHVVMALRVVPFSSEEISSFFQNLIGLL
ncbi:MAG: hypothetical protein CMJ78_01635 [Planctomycetaceae bacterium]|nr:hypothetical protein [Planctomycetaceae bacterium]